MIKLSAAVVAATLLPAQTTTVSPAAMVNTAGGTSTSIPWGPFVPGGNVLGECFVQQIYDDLRGTPRVLRGFAFRKRYTSIHASKTYDVKITLADAATPSTGMSTTFASNYKTGGASTVVFDGKITWPAMPPVPRPPSPFDGLVKFTTSHVYSGKEPLLAETFVRSTTPVTPTHFFERGPPATYTAGVVGKGCIATGQTSPMDATGFCADSTILNTLFFGPVSAPAALWIGDTGPTWGPFTLPLALVMFGSPSCFMNINLILPVIGLTTGSAGSATVRFSYVLGPFTSGVRFRTQWFTLDGTTLRSSNGLDHATTFGGAGIPWPAASVYANGFGATPPATGTSLGIQGLVTEWHH